MSQEAAGLELAFVSTVEALANALEATDALTSSHARAVKDLALSIGRRLDLDPARMKHLELAALLHDIGKIGIPSQILSKPSPLSDEERRLVEQHPQIGERILQPIERLAAVRPIVRHCHERWTGGLPGPAGRQRHPTGGADHLRRRQLPRDDERPAVRSAVTPELACNHLPRRVGDAVRPDDRRGVPRARSVAGGRRRARPRALAAR